LLAIAFWTLIVPAGFAQDSAAKVSSQSDVLLKLSNDFWAWRARFQPFTSDDIPRIEHPGGHRDWSKDAIEKQRAELKEYEQRWKKIDSSGRTVSQQVDYRLIGSAIARVHWELDVNRRWERDPTFYLEQSLTAIEELLAQPPPFDVTRSEELLARVADIPQILADGKKNLRPVRPFARLAIDDLQNIREEMLRVESGVGPLLHSQTKGKEGLANALHKATAAAVVALEGYREWLLADLDKMPEKSAVGRGNYEYFLKNVALLPYTPEQLLEFGHQEWGRTVAFEQFEAQRNAGLPELKIFESRDAQIRKSDSDEIAIRKFLVEKGILSVPAETPHYLVRAMPDYVSALSDFGETDDFGGALRPNDPGTRWINPPSATLGYFSLATAKDTRPITVHEGVPGHFFQLWLSRRHEDPIRREYYDSGSNEGLGFYAEEMMLQAGLFDDSPRSREIIYNFMRLRALRVEVDVKLALGMFTLEQGAAYLAEHVPMDTKTAMSEAAMFSTTPGQAITYQIGKMQILEFLADARMKQGKEFNLRAFHDYLWKNGNVPLVLQRWEYLGDDTKLKTIDARSSLVN
jgi:uncharacterized protein (DUF885 family)